MKFLQNLYESITNNAENFEKRLGSSKAALIYFLINCTFFFIVSLFVKMSKLSGKFYIVAFFRGFFGLVFSQLIFLFSKYSFYCGNQTKIIFIRSILIIQHQFFFYFLTKLIPLSQLWILANTVPIWAYFIKYFVYDMKIKQKEVFGIVISFIGVILVVRPSICFDIFGIKYDKNSIFFHIESSENKYIYAEGFYKFFLCLAFFFSNAGMAYGFILTHYISTPGLMQNAQGFIYFSILTVPFRFFFEDNTNFNLYDSIQIFIFLGIILFCAQVFGVRALSIEKNTGKLTLINYMTVIASYLVEIFSLNEYPSVLNLIGMLFILIGLYIVNK